MSSVQGDKVDFTVQLPLELIVRILSSAVDPVNPIPSYKSLKLVNQITNQIITPLLLCSYAELLSIHLDMASEEMGKSDPTIQKQLQEARLRLTATTQKLDEKKSALHVFIRSKAQASMDDASFQLVLKAIVSLSSEFQLLGTIASFLLSLRKPQKSLVFSKPDASEYIPRGGRPGEYWAPPEAFRPPMGREPEDWRRDRMPPGPEIPLIDDPYAGGGGGGGVPFGGPTFHPPPRRVFGEPDPDELRPPGFEREPGFYPPGRDPTSPFGTGLPPPNPFQPHGRGRGFEPRFI